MTKIRFLGHEIFENNIKPINRVLEFTTKFPDELKDKNQLQRFLECLNYVADFFKYIRIICKPLFQRLKKNPKPWSSEHTQAVLLIKSRIKYLPCLSIPNPKAFLIVETDNSDIGYGGILKKKNFIESKELLVMFHSGSLNDT